jgi:triosephosphate isomerase
LIYIYPAQIILARMRKKAVFIINFKAYEESVGKNAVRLAKICERMGKLGDVEMIVAVQEQDLYRVSCQVSIEVFAQHVDPIGFGAFTGHDLPEGMKESGAKGTLINHAEHRLDLATIKKTVERAKEAGLRTVVCANTPELAAKIARFSPDFIAIEPSELIGSEKSVSTAKPEIISGTIKKVQKVNKVPVLCGAGVKDGNDVRVALKLGAAGILASSHIVKAKEPEKVLKELIEGTK